MSLARIASFKVVKEASKQFSRKMIPSGPVAVTSRNDFGTSSRPLKDKKLFTPGPLGVQHETKASMLRDLGSRDIEFMNTIKYIREKTLEVAKICPDTFTMVPMQGSGTFSVEASIMTLVPKVGGKLLVAYTGSYGQRITEIARYSNIDTVIIKNNEDEMIDLKEIEKTLIDDKSITTVAVVHCETSAGVIHPIHEVGELVRKHAPQAKYFVDAMSSFGSIPVDMKNIDCLVTSSNKCIEGVPGFGLVIARKEALLQSKGNCRSLSLDIVEQYLGLEKAGQFRFTPPTHAILAFKKALELWEAEGGVDGRGARYQNNREILREGMTKLGFKEFLAPHHKGYIITSYHFPDDPNFEFKEFYNRLNDLDMVIYPGKTTAADCFRIGNIGNLHAQDMRDLLVAIEKVFNDMNIKLPLQ